jgi:hypothetical protein
MSPRLEVDRTLFECAPIPPEASTESLMLDRRRNYDEPITGNPDRKRETG